MVEMILGQARERRREVDQLREALDVALQERNQYRQRAKSEARWARARAYADQQDEQQDEQQDRVAEKARTDEDLDCRPETVRRLRRQNARLRALLGEQPAPKAELAGSHVDLPTAPPTGQQGVIDTFLADELARVRAERDDLRAEVERLLDDPDCPEGHDLAPVEAVGDVTCCRQCGVWFRVYEKGFDRLPPLPRTVAQLDEARAQRDEARHAAWHLWYRGDDDGISEEEASRWYPWIGTRTVGPPQPKQQP